jgi:hypothetical protein
MALCPLAIASKGNANDGTGEYYFALSGGGTGPVVDQAFVATGTGTPPNGGTFSTRSEDLTGAGVDAFIMTDISGVRRWAIGTSGVEAGANSGDNFAIFAYADDGSFLTAPLTINRASGGVVMTDGLTVGNSAQFNDLSGVNIEATGSLVGPDGPVLSQQVDFVTEQIVAVPSAPGAGQTIIAIGATFTVPRTGLYILSGLLSYDGSGGTTFVAAPQDFFSVIVSASPPSPGSFQGAITVPLTVNGELDRVWEGMATVKLTGGIPYQANFFLENVSGTVAATGGATLVGSYDLVALC